MKFKMAATAGLSLTLDPMGKMFQNASSLKSGINSGHHYLPTYQIFMISDNVEFLTPIFYAVFWQPF
jgi:hypothetical protein